MIKIYIVAVNKCYSDVDFVVVVVVIVNVVFVVLLVVTGHIIFGCGQ